MGGSDDPSNLIQLTIEEHALAHLKLYEEYGKVEDLWAYKLLSNQIGFEEGFRKVMRKAAYDTHEKCKRNKTGFFSSEQQSLNGKKGGLASIDRIKKLAKENNRKVCCPHCGKEGQYAVMKRWHFNNCKSIDLHET